MIQPHHRLIADAFERIADGSLKRLRIEMPPRSGKSRLTQEFIAWYLGHFPFNDVIYSGHSVGLLQGFSRNIRNRIQSGRYKKVFDTEIAADSAAINNWNVKDGGEFAIFGVGGGITGKGFNCIVKGTEVVTIDGVRNIEDIKPGEYVLSFNHRTNEYEFKRVLATRYQKKGNTYSVRSGSGSGFDATGEHLTFVVGQGYKEVERCKPNEKVILSPCDGKLRALREKFREESARRTESTKDRNEIFLLQSLLPMKEIFQKVRFVLNGLGKAFHEILPYLSKRKTQTPRKTTEDKLRFLRKGNHSIVASDEVLRNGMQERQPFDEDVLKRESELEALNGDGAVSERIQDCKEFGNRAGWFKMHGVPYPRGTSRTSQGYEPSEQRNGESRDGMPFVPSEAPSFESDSISSVTPNVGFHEVYDLQVEGNSNFFAGGILVHNCGIIDDPYASREDAESDTIRAKTIDWYNSTFYSRRQSENAAIVLIMQRWREDDLAGQIEEQDGDEWEVIKIPAINEAGESFWPDKFSVDDLQDVRKKLGDYFFESQYQQNPVDLAGGAFNTEMFQHYTREELEAVDLSQFRLYTALDPAIGQKDGNDYTAISTIAVNPRSNDVYVLECIRGRWLPDQIITELFATVRRWGVRHVGVECVQYQKMLILEIRKQMRMRDQFFVLDEITPMGEKNARMVSTLQPRYSNRSVLHPNSGVEELELELLKFPNGKHDDMMDSLSMAVSMAHAANVGREPPKERQYHDKISGAMVRPSAGSNRGAMFGLSGGDPSPKRFL